MPPSTNVPGMEIVEFLVGALVSVTKGDNSCKVRSVFQTIELHLNTGEQKRSRFAFVVDIFDLVVNFSKP